MLAKRGIGALRGRAEHFLCRKRGGNALVAIQNASATYNDSQFAASGTFYENVTGFNYALFKGSLALPYTGSSTSALADSGPFTGKFDLGGLTVTFNQLTFETGAVRLLLEPDHA